MDTEPVLAAAKARGLEIGALLESHGYFEAWAVGEALVMRIPRVRPLIRPIQRDEGPLVLDGDAIVGVDAKRLPEIFNGAVERQRTVVTPLLPRFLDLIELAGTSVSLFERPPGRPIAAMDIADVRPRLPAIAAALAELHASFGFHGDLSPTHIFLDGDTVMFTDPLPAGPAIGTAGYALPISDHSPEAMRARDLGALAAIATAMQGAWLGYEGATETIASNMRPFLYGMEIGEHLLGHHIREAGAGFDAIVGSLADRWLRDWIRGATQCALDAIIDEPDDGTTRPFLYRYALTEIAARANATPSLLAFLAAQQQREVTHVAQHAALDVLGAVHDNVIALDRLLAIVDDIHALFVKSFAGEPVVTTALAPVEHPERMWEESHDLHVLLVDVAALLAGDVHQAGARFARIAETAPKAREHYRIATRRYINFVCSPF